MKRIHALAVAAVAAMCPLASSAAQIAVIGDAVFARDAGLGESYQARLQVRNTTDTPQEARIYQTDYSFAADGRTFYSAAGSMSRSNAKWVACSPTYVMVPAATTVPVVCTIAVPKDSSLIGTYWSMVMVEPIVPGSVNSRKPANARVDFGLSVNTRYGTQIATNIGASGASKLAFDSLTATTAPSGDRGLRFDFINTGERAHRFVMSLELYNEAGELVKKASQSRGLLYPGTAARQDFDVGALPHGAYTAVLVADAGGDQVFGGQFKVAY
ncbi:MAG: hypothetical protein JWM41_206 [Gemmatimonadetes bacterium]|nr:hypothetical protein [Gemmatimonadota bacterium]